MKSHAPAAVLLLAVLASCAGILSGSSAQSEFDLGVSLLNQGRPEEALPHFQRAIELAPDFSDAYLFLAKSYLSLGRWKEAIPPLKEAFRLDPKGSGADIRDLIFDILMQRPSSMDSDTRSQLEDIIRPR